MAENYIHIFCAFVAELVDNNKLTTEDMGFMMHEFIKVAEHLSSREQLLTFLADYPDYPEFQPLIERLKDHNYIF